MFQGKNTIYDFDDDNMPPPEMPSYLKDLFGQDDKQGQDKKQIPINQSPNMIKTMNEGIPGMPIGFNALNTSGQKAFNSPMVQLDGFNPMFPINPMNLSQQNMSSNQLNLSQNAGHLGNNSRNQSMNLSMSRDSRADLSTSKSKSKSNARANKSYQNTINEDIVLIERIEGILNNITSNHFKVCPYSARIIDIKKCNFQNISAFFSNTTKKYYLTYFDGYLKANSNPAGPKIISLIDLPFATVNTTNTITPIDTSQYLRSDRKAYFVSIEGFHPISTYLLFKIEKICYGLEHGTHRNQLIYLNLANKSTSIFEPNSYMVPYSEFRLVITIHSSHSNEDPYTFEFLADLSTIRVTADQKSKFVEAYYLEGGNNIICGTQVIFDPNAEVAQNLNYKVNLDTSFSGQASPSVKPDWGKNLFVVLKYFTFSLPLKKVEKKVREPVSQSSLDENSLSGKQGVQKKPHSKMALNPNAPLFSNNTTPFVEQMQQQNSNSFYPQTNVQQPNVQNPNMGGFKPQTTQQPFNPQFGGGTPQQQNFFNPNVFQAGFNLDQGMGNMKVNPQLNNFQNDFTVSPNFRTNPSDFPPGLTGSQTQQGQNDFGFNNQGMNQFFPQTEKPNLSVNTNFRQNNFQQRVNIANAVKEGGFSDVMNIIDESRSDRSGTPDNVGMPEGDPKTLGTKNSLYVAALKKDSGSGANSPGVISRIAGKYFSGVSTPQSNLSQDEGYLGLTPRESEKEPAGFDETPTNIVITDDMIENFKLEDHIGNLCEFAKTYQGSRVLQKFFPRANQQEIDTVIQEFESKIDELMLDPYANYMFQSLAQSCSADQRFYLLQKIAPSMVKVACDRKGTHSLQAIVSLINRDVEDKLIKETLDGHILELSFDAQGTHLVQKLISSISQSNIDFIYQPIIEKFVEVANNSYGLCVLKQLMSKVEKIPEYKKRILDLLHENLENLIQNPFGNYAIQHALEVYPKDCNGIMDKVLDKLIQYSNQKFSSNVIEKCLTIASPEYRKKFLTEILKTDRLTELMKNKYGNYVIFKALTTSEMEDKQRIMEYLNRCLSSINVPKYKTRWMQFIEENPLKVPNVSPNMGMKPSLFKASSSTYNESQDSFNKRNDTTADDSWENEMAQNINRGLGPEFSQFYYQNNNQQMNQMNQINQMNAMAQMNQMNQMMNNNLGMNPNMMVMGGQRMNPNMMAIGGQGISPNQVFGGYFTGDNRVQQTSALNTSGNSKKPVGGNSNTNKNYNQKFYQEKNQHHVNKGYNNLF